jgi:hypothetical protein
VIRETFELLAQDVWVKIQASSKYNLLFGEETITDILLMELALKQSFNIKIIQTPKHL